MTPNNVAQYITLIMLIYVLQSNKTLHRNPEFQGNDSIVHSLTPLNMFHPPVKGGRRSPAVACWASDHWVASSNPLRGKFRH